MFEEFDRYISYDFSDDYWYDEGFSIARDMLNKFSTDEWENLYNVCLEKNLSWQKNLVYCINNTKQLLEIKILISLLNSTDDDELFNMCIDSLREFDDDFGREQISANKKLLAEVVEKHKNTPSIVTKKILEDFIKRFS